MLYLGFKVLHVAAVIVFLGNIFTGLFWKAHADRTREPRFIANALEGIIRSDRWFTLPGIAAVVIGGVGAAIVAGIPMLHTGWILWSIGLFVFSGLVFVGRIEPIQAKMLTLARAGQSSDQFNWAQYWTWSREWLFWGLVAIIAPAIVVILMVFKPALPAF